MILEIDNKKVLIEELVFKPTGVSITQSTGEKDLYTYSFLQKHEVLIK